MTVCFNSILIVSEIIAVHLDDPLTYWVQKPVTQNDLNLTCGNLKTIATYLAAKCPDYQVVHFPGQYI